MQELNLRVLLGVLIQKLKWIIVAAVVIAMVMGGYVALFVEASYASTCSMYVMNLTSLDNGQASSNTGISASGLSASQQMVNEYISLLKADMVIDDVASQLRQQGYEMSNREIRSTLTMTSKNGTSLLEIRSTTNDPIKSKAICDALMDTAPEKIKRVMLDLGTITPVDYADQGSRVSSGALRYAAMGGVIGAVLAYAFFLLLYLMDNTVKSEQDLKNRLDVTVLGAVPDLHSAGNKKGGKYYYA
ncbi:MAG: hypothetical protein IJ518_08385 [Clostridia bacterium]|nr:hypothetical protein [Clostridia bacterium]